MNTLVKTLPYRSLLSIRFLPISFRKQQILLFGFALTVLMSAFGLIYLKDINRRLFSQLDTLQVNHTQLRNAGTQQLLEKMRLANQAHVAQVARTRLKMEVPSPKAVVMIHS